MCKARVFLISLFFSFSYRGAKSMIHLNLRALSGFWKLHAAEQGSNVGGHGIERAPVHHHHLARRQQEDSTRYQVGGVHWYSFGKKEDSEATDTQGFGFFKIVNSHSFCKSYPLACSLVVAQ